MIGSWKEKIAGSVIEAPSWGEQILCVALEAFESAADVDQARVVEIVESAEKLRVESFSGRVDDDEIVGIEWDGVGRSAGVREKSLFRGGKVFEAF